MCQVSDEELMNGVMAGDTESLGALVHRYHAPLLGYVYRLCGPDSSMAEDLVQETFVRLLRQTTYRRGMLVKPWLYRIATNLAYDAFRTQRRRGETAPDEASHEMPEDGPGPEEMALAGERSRMVQVAFGKLPEEYRSVLVLRYYQDLSLREIATTLQIPLGTVKSRLSVGTRRLHDLLTDYEAARS